MEPRQVDLGEEFEVELEGVPTSGHLWTLEHDPAWEHLLQLVSSKTIPSTPNLVGGSAKQVFLFRTLGIGEAQLAFRYGRSWESAVRETRQVGVVVVQPLGAES